MGYLKVLEAYETGGSKRIEILKKEQWLIHIGFTETAKVNLERVESLSEVRANYIYEYVKRTLKILEGSTKPSRIKDIVYQVLIWSEVAKAGMPHQRKIWSQKGYNLDVHNIGSAQIYKDFAFRTGVHDQEAELIETLISTHGLIGQYLRGEVNFEMNRPLNRLVENGIISAEQLVSILQLLNECIIRAVSDSLWLKLESKVYRCIDGIADPKNSLSKTNEYPLLERIGKLRASAVERGENTNDHAKYLPIEVYTTLFENASLWYVEAALSDFNYLEFTKIMTLACVKLSEDAKKGVHYQNISFEPLMNDIYYELDGHKCVNLYKKRIIEKYLKEVTMEEILQGNVPGNQHIQSSYFAKEAAGTLYMGFTYSPAAQKLIEFCQEAEKSDVLYEKAIILLYDLFELRKDGYDRFHEEARYLSTMNQSIDHKKVLLDHIVGKTVIDIGPGGGALMDRIEERYPDKYILGVDISTNVIEALEKRKMLEHKNWHVLYANALNLKDYVEPKSIDSIIFCSILHELYSYIEYEGRQFNHKTVAAALKSAFDVLPVGGRIIIRDGVMTEPTTSRRIIRFLSKEGMAFLDNYCRDFKGRNVTYTVCGLNEVMMPVNDAMEFLYTYTWGEKSYIHEVQEQFGYFTPTEFNAFIHEQFKDTLRIVSYEHFLQDGYELALASKIEFFDEDHARVALPDSTYIAVLEKVKEE